MDGTVNEASRDDGRPALWATTGPVATTIGGVGTVGARIGLAGGLATALWEGSGALVCGFFAAGGLAILAAGAFAATGRAAAEPFEGEAFRDGDTGAASAVLAGRETGFVTCFIAILEVAFAPVVFATGLMAGLDWPCGALLFALAGAFALLGLAFTLHS